MTAPTSTAFAPGRTVAPADPRQIVAGWRWRLHVVASVRALLAGVGVWGLLSATIRLLASWSIGAAPSGSRAGWDVLLPLLAGGVAAAFVAWRSAAISLSAERVALWIEEQAPGLRFALVTAVDDAVTPAVRESLARVAGAVPWEGAARAALGRSLRWPALLALAGALSAWLAPAAAVRAAGRTSARSPAPGGSAAAVALGEVVISLQPPRYTGRPPERVVDPALVRAYPGTRASLTGRGAAGATEVRVDSTLLSVRDDAVGWSAAFATGAARALVRVERRGGAARLVALEPLVDSAPRVALRAPARDTILRLPTGSIPLVADLEDDLGLATAGFEYIVSSGEGERFTFTSGSLGGLPSGSGTRATMRATMRATLSLDALQLTPGDVVTLRAVARDRNDVSGPGVGSSEPRTIRIARADEYDSVAVDQAPPPEVDKSLLSQRMLINLTEALVKRARTIPRGEVTGESRRIGRDQARLRKQVSDIIFARLGDGGEGGGEHFHGDGHQHGDADTNTRAPLTPEALLKAAERATEISGSPTDFEHDETPVVAINRPMLEAYNAMWDAGRALDGGEPARALPPMYAALAAIQRARAAERLYLRGAPPRVVVDLSRVRMQGKDEGRPGARRPRPSLDPVRARWLGRFAGALTVLGRDPSAGVDSLLVLRLAVADRLPLAATALEQAIDAVRASRDATDPLLRARRALDGTFAVRDSLSAWGGVP